MLNQKIVVTGAFSGIGKAFVRAYLEHSDSSIVAIDRRYSREHLSWDQRDASIQNAITTYRKDVGDDSAEPRVLVLSIDITDEAQLAQLSSIQDVAIVIHCAGVRGLVPSIPVSQSTDVACAETMDTMTSQTMTETFHINAIGTFLLIRTLTPVLRNNGGKVIIMGSRMGSIGNNSTGGGYAYRASKAALNAIVKSFSIDVPEVTFVTVHPGRVESNLVGEGVKEDGAIEAAESVKDLLELIPRLRKKESGRFIDRFGGEIVW